MMSALHRARHGGGAETAHDEETIAIFVESLWQREFGWLCALIVLTSSLFSASHNQPLACGAALFFAVCLLASAPIRGNPLGTWRGGSLILVATSWMMLVALEGGINSFVWIAPLLILAPAILPVRASLSVSLLQTAACSFVALRSASQIDVLMVGLGLAATALLFEAAFRRLRRVEADSMAAARWATASWKLGDTAILNWDVKRDKTTYSDNFSALLGDSGLDNLRPSQGFIGLIAPQEQERVTRDFEEQIEQLRRPFERRLLMNRAYTLLRTDGRPVQVHACALLEADGDGMLDQLRLAIVSSERETFSESELAQAHQRIRRQAQELALQYETMRAAVRSREEVERIARHDLKTPLASIAAIPHLLRRLRQHSAEEENLLSVVERAAKRVLSMLNLSTDLYRMESREFNFVPVSVDLQDLTARIVAEMKIQADSKHVTLKLLGSRLPVFAKANEILCHSILENLLRNAIEAAPDGSQVTIAMYSGQRVGVSIHNLGAVHPSMRTRFFEKYATHGKVGGLGVGTYSARLMAKAQHGELKMFTSDARGTTLTLKLERYGGAANAAADADTIPAELLGASGLATSAPATERPALDLLIVDDDEHNAFVIASWLPSHVRVRHVVNGRAALTAVMERRPDIILMDLEMPIMGGIESHAKIRAQQKAAGEKASRIIALSAHDDARVRRQVEAEGFDDFVLKPITQTALLLMVEEPVVAPVAERESLWINQHGADMSRGHLE